MAAKFTGDVEGRQFLLHVGGQVEVFRSSFQGMRNDQTRAPSVDNGKNVVNHGSTPPSSRYRCMMLKVGRLASSPNLNRSKVKRFFLVRPVLGHPPRLGPNGSWNAAQQLPVVEQFQHRTCSISVPRSFHPRSPFSSPRSSDRQRTNHTSTLLFTRRGPSLRERSTYDPCLSVSPHFARAEG